MNEPLQRIYLVRHGETAWTLTGQHTGRTDIALTSHGEQKATELGERLRELPVATVMTSPLNRAIRTAQMAGFGDRLQSEPDLAEWDYGAYEGRRTAEIRAERPDWRLFSDGCPDGESPDDVGERADRLIAKIRGLEGNVLMFSHADILRVVIARWIALPATEGRRLHLDTASMSTLGYDHGLDEPVILVLNAV